MENLNLKNIFSNKKFYIVFLILAVALAVVFGLVFIPAFENLKNLESQLKKEIIKLEEAKNDIGVLGRGKPRMVTDLADVAQALDEITKKAGQSGFKFDSVKQGEPIAIGGNLKILTITIGSVCDYPALNSFLSSLENLRRSVSVVNKLNVEKDKVNTNNLKVSLELGMYMLL